MERSFAPAFQPITNINLIKAKSTALDNGIPLHIIDAGNQPVIKLEFLYKSGAWFENIFGLSYLTSKLLLEGTSKKTSKEISNLFEQYGASIDLNPGLDLVSVSIYCITKFLPKVLELTKEILFESTFPEEEIQTQKILKIQNIKVNNEKNNIVAAKLLRKNLFGKGHPYGHDLSADDINNITKKNIENYFKQTFNDNFEIVVSGKIGTDEIEMLNKTFGQIQRTDQSNDIEHHISSNIHSQVVEKAKSLQSSIRIGRKIFTKSHPDYIDLIITNEIFGGYFGSRLMKNIREDKGFTYGISSNVLTLQNEGFFVIGTEVKKEHTQATIDEIHKEMKLLRTQLIPQEELETVKNFMLGSFLSEINTPFCLADKFKSIYFNNLKYDFYDQYINRINNIKREEICAIAEKYLDEASMIEVVVGGKV